MSQKMNKYQKMLSFFPTGALGIDRMAVGCYKTGAIKGLSSAFLWLTPIPWLWWGMDVGATFLDDKYIFCDGQAMSAEMMQKVGKFFTYVTGIAAAAAAAYQAQKFAKKMGVPGVRNLAKKMPRIPGMSGMKMPGMSGMKMPGMSGMSRILKGGGKIEGNNWLQNMILFSMIVFFSIKN